MHNRMEELYHLHLIVRIMNDKKTNEWLILFLRWKTSQRKKGKEIIEKEDKNIYSERGRMIIAYYANIILILISSFLSFSLNIKLLFIFHMFVFIGFYVNELLSLSLYDWIERKKIIVFLLCLCVHFLKHKHFSVVKRERMVILFVNSQYFFLLLTYTFIKK
jgi:hypothetical protein